MPMVKESAGPRSHLGGRIDRFAQRGQEGGGIEPAQGGFARLNKIFDGQLAELLNELTETIWQTAA